MRDDGAPSDPVIRRLLILICVLGLLGATYAASLADPGAMMGEESAP